MSTPADTAREEVTTTVRYYSLPNGVYKHNYATGKKERLDDIGEARQLFAAAKLYQLSVPLFDLTLDGFGGSESDESAGATFGRSDDMLTFGGLEDCAGSRYLFLVHLCHSLAEQCAPASYDAFGRIITVVDFDRLSTGDKQLALPELQAYVNWLVEDGHSSTGLIILDQFEKASGVLSARAALEVATMRARAALALGEWAEAENQINRCFGVLSSDAFEASAVLHGIVRAHSMNIDLLLMQGCGKVKIRDAFSLLNEVWHGRPEDFHGSATEARFHRIRGRVNGAIATCAMEERAEGGI